MKERPSNVVKSWDRAAGPSSAPEIPTLGRVPGCCCEKPKVEITRSNLAQPIFDGGNLTGTFPGLKGIGFCGMSYGPIEETASCPQCGADALFHPSGEWTVRRKGVGT